MPAAFIVVSGHYDSRNSDPGCTAGAAPGANDDASGTAVSLECARVLSKHRFPATIIFLTVAGEEQGLYGSAHFAKMAKAVGWDIEGVLNNDIVGGDRTPGDTLQDPHVVRVFSEGIPSSGDGRRTEAHSLARRRERRALAATGALCSRDRAKNILPPATFQPHAGIPS